MTHPFVSPELAAGLDEPAATALAEIAEVSGRRYRVDRWLTNGRSGAKVVIVYEDDRGAGSSRRLVLKRTAPGDPARRLTEVLRDRRAYDTAPPAFRDAHMARPVYHPCQLADGSCMTLAEIAGDDIDQVRVLTDLLNAMLDGTPGSRCDPATFARACGDVVGGILGEWTGRPQLAPEWLTAEQFLGRHVLDQMEPGGRLYALALRYAGAEINVPGEPRPMSNPFALARGTHPGSKTLIPALIGRCHGDCHSDNLLIQVNPTINGTRFHLVDLPLSEPDDPVTRDPAHFLLYILARRMDVISPAQQSALIDILTIREGADPGFLPGWLAELIREINGACLAWLKGTGLQPEWRRQRLLSLAGCGMLFLGRTSTRPEDKEWFLRLAARATEAFLDATMVSTVHPNAA